MLAILVVNLVTPVLAQADTARIPECLLVSGDAANVLDMVLVGQHWGESGLTGWIRLQSANTGLDRS